MEEELEGVASIALLPSGSLSGHFVHPLTSTCLGLFGTEMECERECSRGEDYRLIKLTILNFATNKEKQAIVECRGHDAACFQNASDVSGWEDDVMQAVEATKVDTPFVTFECELLKADKDAEEHIKRYLPSLVGMDAIVNIGKMKIKGLKFDHDQKNQEEIQSEVSTSPKPVSKEGFLSCSKSCNDSHTATTNSSTNSSTPRLYSQNMPLFGDELDQLVMEELKAEGISESVLREKWSLDTSGWITRT